MKRVIVHIDELLLHGFKTEHRHAIAAGVQKQLGQVFANREMLAQLTARGDMGRIKIGGVLFENGCSKPQLVGERVAHSIGQEMKK